MSRPSPSPPPGLCTCCPLCLAPTTLTSAQLAPSCCSALISKVASSGSLSLITLLWLDLHCPALFLLKQFLFVDIMTSLIEITGRRSTNPCSILKSPFSGVERKSGLFGSTQSLRADLVIPRKNYYLNYGLRCVVGGRGGRGQADP